MTRPDQILSIVRRVPGIMPGQVAARLCVTESRIEPELSDLVRSRLVVEFQGRLYLPGVDPVDHD